MLIGHNNPHLPNPLDTSPWEWFNPGHVCSALEQLYGATGARSIIERMNYVSDTPEIRARNHGDADYIDIVRVALEHPPLMAFLIGGAKHVDWT